MYVLGGHIPPAQGHPGMSPMGPGAPPQGHHGPPPPPQTHPGGVQGHPPIQGR